MENCRVCGSKDISRFWSGRIGPLVYCSFRCSAIGNRYINLVFSFILGIFLIFLTTLALETPPHRLGEGLWLYLIFGFAEIYFLLITIYGFISNP
ncbi:MAG: hypothetical protein ACW98W_00950 [Candidatus Hodarchaeales archaeon]|jgi:hypothetical protein